jgi:tol-pal system protein YbgF
MFHRRTSFPLFRSTIASAWLLPFASLLVMGCATSPVTQPRPAELEYNMVELRAQNAGYLRQIDELQNRIFILEDKLQSRPFVADNRRSGPISRTLGEDPSPAPVVAAPAVATGVVEDPSVPNVEYAGEAALPPRRGGARPLLRLSGNGRPVITNVAVNERAPAPSHTRAPDPTQMSTRDARAAVDLYLEGVVALRGGHDAAAITTFRKFLKRYPKHHLGDNAQFELGLCYYDLKQYRAAVRELRLVGERYPQGNKVPEAMLKLGDAQLALGDTREARQVLESLRHMYPRHSASQLATERLAKVDDKVSSTVSLETSGR